MSNTLNHAASLHRMQPVVIHYQLQDATPDGLCPCVIVVEIDGGSLSVACLIDQPTPAALGAMVGVIAESLVANAPFFPGAARAEARSTTRFIPFPPLAQDGGEPPMMEAEVTFVPASSDTLDDAN